MALFIGFPGYSSVSLDQLVSWSFYLLFLPFILNPFFEETNRSEIIACHGRQNEACGELIG